MAPMMNGAAGTSASPISVSRPKPSQAHSRPAASARSMRSAPMFCPTTAAVATDSPRIGPKKKFISRVPMPKAARA